MKKIPIQEIKLLPEEKNESSQVTEQVFQSTSKKVEQIIPTVQKKPLLILITGGAASGKTTFTKQLKEKLEKEKEAITLSTDFYYAYSPLLFQSRNPILHEIFQWKELNKDLSSLLAGKSIYSPTYDAIERKFTRSTIQINPTPIIILEGVLSFFNKEIREKSDLKIYLEVAENIRLERRLERYKKGLEEGKFTKPIEFEIERFHKGKPKENQENYVEPAKKYADLVVNNDYGSEVEKVVEAIEEKLGKIIINESKQN